jgi:exoribonuclease II
MEDFPKLRALMEQRAQKRVNKERKEQQAKAAAVQQHKQQAKAAAVQQHKQTVQAVEHDTLRDWVATQNARMKQAPPKDETKDSLADWTFEKQKF